MSNSGRKINLKLKRNSDGLKIRGVLIRETDKAWHFDACGEVKGNRPRVVLPKSTWTRIGLQR